MASRGCDLVCRGSSRGSSRRIVRHKNQKDSCADANTDAQTSETHHKESFAGSISESDTEDEIKAQKSISQCGKNACSREEGLAQSESFACPKNRIRQLSVKSAADHRCRPCAHET